MAIKSRIEKIEKVAKPKRIALFTIHYGKASGAAWWNDKLTWSDLTKREYEQLVADLEAEGVKVISIDIIGVYKKGAGINGWNEEVKI